MIKPCLLVLLACFAAGTLRADDHDRLAPKIFVIDSDKPNKLFPELPNLPVPAPIIAKSKCEAVDTYKPKKGTFRLYRVKLHKRWETRFYCSDAYSGKNPVVEKQPYKVLVTTYRERYSDGTQRIWKCVHPGTEVMLASK